MHSEDTTTRRIGRKTLILAAVALVLSTLTVYTFYNMNGHSLDVTNREFRLIVTDSMDGEPRNEYAVPTIQKDSMVMVRFVSEGEKPELQPGDVIQFRYGSILNHHRVIENNVEGGYVITKGDNTTSTEKVDYADIRGEVIGADHTAGVVVSFVKHYVFVIIAFIVVLYMGSLLYEEIRSEKEKEK